MTAFLEVWTPSGVALRTLDPPRVTVGRRPTNDIALEHDTRASRLHAVVEAYGDDWVIRDLGSAHGTWLRGERIFSDRALRHGDEVVIGTTRLVYRANQPASADPTESGTARPELTRRERDVLHALCRPLFSGATFTEPASLRQIAAELVVSEAAVKQHLMRLYDKFALADRRRVQLANEAIRSGLVSLGDLRDDPS